MCIVNVNKNLSVVYGEYLAVGYEIATLPDTTVTVDYQVMPIVLFRDTCYALKYGNVSGQFYAPDAATGAEEIQHLLARNERHSSYIKMNWDGITEYQSRYSGIPMGSFEAFEEGDREYISYLNDKRNAICVIGTEGAKTLNSIEVFLVTNARLSTESETVVPAIMLVDNSLKGELKL